MVFNASIPENPINVTFFEIQKRPYIDIITLIILTLSIGKENVLGVKMIEGVQNCITRKSLFLGSIIGNKI